MNFSSEDWPQLIEHYAQANSGSFLPGLAHNLNNCGHIIDLQLELLWSKFPDSTANTEDLKKRLSRIESASKELLAQLECVSHRFVYLQKDNLQLDLATFFDWLARFWRNHLFFKHKITPNFTVSPGCPNLDLPPFLLTFALEEAIKNGIEMNQHRDADGPLVFKALAKPLKTGVVITLITPNHSSSGQTSIEAQATPPQAGCLGFGMSLVRHCAELVGWKVSTRAENSDFIFDLEIPSMKTQSPFSS